mgnify:CR=1 FL=1
MQRLRLKHGKSMNDSDKEKFGEIIRKWQSGEYLSLGTKIWIEWVNNKGLIQFSDSGPELSEDYFRLGRPV